MKIKQLLEYIPLFTICLLYFGYVNLSSYYAAFGISIYQYIDTTEIFLSFFPKIVFLLSSLFLLFIQYLYTFTISKSIDVTQEEGVTIDKSAHFFKHSGKYVIVSFLFMTITSLLLPIWFESYTGWYRNLQSLLAMSLFFFTIIFLFVNMRERLVNFSLVYFFALIVALGYILNVHRTSEAEERKRKVSKEKISFKYNNATIVSDSSICYIGQTSNYIFLYNRMDSSTSIFNLNNCDSITIKGFKN